MRFSRADTIVRLDAGLVSCVIKAKSNPVCASHAVQCAPMLLPLATFWRHTCLASVRDRNVRSQALLAEWVPRIGPVCSAPIDLASRFVCCCRSMMAEPACDAHIIRGSAWHDGNPRPARSRSVQHTDRAVG